MKSVLLLPFLLIVMLSGCSKDEASTPTGTARYQVTFTGAWTAETHPLDYPSNDHFSPLIGMTHAEGLTLFTEGVLASSGVKRMAELGALAPLDAEITTLTDDGRLGTLVTGEWLPTGTSSTEVMVELTGEAPYLSLVSMIAPSPDWFVAVTGVDLWDNGWVDALEVPAVLYDAGTDSGVSYESPNQETQPPQSIQRLVEPPLGIGAGVDPPVAYFTFTRL